MSSASAKVILFGEHAVVYGQPAIAVPVSSMRAYAEVVNEGCDFQIVARDLDDKIITFDGDDPLAQVTRLTLKVIGKAIPRIKVAVRSDIPIASGLGSGAAISTAIIRCLLDYFAIQVDNEVVNEIVYEVEKIHHGTPSGIDNTVIVYEQAVYFVREKPIEMIRIARPLRLIVADTGQAALTKIAVGDVRRLYESRPQAIRPVIEKIGEISYVARQAMQSGDVNQLGALMLENHQLLRELTVSSEQLDSLVDIAIDAGALGAKLSGGGRGGNMIALVDSERSEAVQSALKNAGAVRVFETIVEASS